MTLMSPLATGSILRSISGLLDLMESAVSLPSYKWYWCHLWQQVHTIKYYFCFYHALLMSPLATGAHNQVDISFAGSDVIYFHQHSYWQQIKCFPMGFPLLKKVHYFRQNEPKDTKLQQTCQQLCTVCLKYIFNPFLHPLSYQHSSPSPTSRTIYPFWSMKLIFDHFGLFQGKSPSKYALCVYVSRKPGTRNKRLVLS